MRIPWTEKKSSEEVMELAGYKRSPYSKPAEKDDYNFLGIKTELVDCGLEKQILSGKICGTKSKGRQCTKYTDSLNNFVTRKESPNNELIKRNDDREEWEAMMVNVCKRPGT